MTRLQSLPLLHRLRRTSPALRRLALLLIFACALFLLWPYVTLWRLNELIRDQPPSALGPLVDIDSIRDQVLRRLNKDAHSNIGVVSDHFIGWIEQSIRTPGNETLQQSVSLEWLHGLLSNQAVGERGFLSAVDYAFFDSLNGFLVRVDKPDYTSLYLRMELGLLGWRVVAVHY
ncbi:MAG: DUF2939 domain-containing protein [Thiohalocapsa sp. PB-PSB1]|jgi:hypothetical protein|nr:MAG: hypothetical protein N838_17015 [Thiohalocapsa sp. PB-PSB1]QQO52598.1 MAG: DUF2939 domain-containing protein [Thiohalocapsa sp. PB-PSB1]